MTVSLGNGVDIGNIVTAETNPVTGGIELLVDSDTFYPASAGLAPTDVDIMFYRPVGGEVKVSVPTPYPGIGDEAVVHPAAVFVPGGFLGYRYFLAFSPLPGNVNSYENPCVCASNDPLSGWVVLPNTINPLATPVNSPTSYNRDPHIYYDSVGKRLILIWNEFGTPQSNKIQLKLMTFDGTWTPPTVIYTGTVGTSDIVSPSIWYNDVSNLWEIIGVNADSVNRELNKITSASLLSGWSVTPTNLVYAKPVGWLAWHPWLMRLPSGRIIGLMMDSQSPGASGRIGVIQSLDGVNFDYAHIKTETDSGHPFGKWYRGCFFAVEDSAGTHITMILSQIGNKYLIGQKIELTPGYIGVKTNEYAQVAKATEIGRLSSTSIGVFADNFIRADTTDVGTSLSGGVWSQVFPSDKVGIVGNKAYNTTTNGCICVAPNSLASYSAICIIDTIGTECYMQVSRVDASHMWRFGSVSTLLKLQRFNGAMDVDVFAGLGVLSPVIKHGDVLRADVSSKAIRFYVNGQLVYKTDNLGFEGLTTVALQISGAVQSKVSHISILPL